MSSFSGSGWAQFLGTLGTENTPTPKGQGALSEVGGHVRIPNRLFEAIVSAGFTELQLRIVLAILRLSLGWQRGSVCASYAELAQFVGYRKASGGFRDAVKDLVQEGVIALLAEGGGANAAAYVLQRNYGSWGKYSQSEAKLEAIWGKRPENEDQLPLQILTLHATSDETPTVPVQRHPPCLPTGTPPASTEARSPDGSADRAETSARGKTVKDNEILQPAKKLGLGEAMELLAGIDQLKERSTGEVKRTFLRLDRVRDAYGADVADAVRLVGVDRFLATKPEHRGILTNAFIAALSRVRERIQQRERQA